MTRTIAPVQTLLIAIFVLMLGNGFIATLLGVRMEAEQMPAALIGAMATAYFSGLTVGALRAPALVQRVGHIRGFAAAVSLLSASTLAYGLHTQIALWIALRLIDGLCIATVYVCIESWLNNAANERTRGTILAAYMIALYSAQAAGQFMLNLPGEAIVPFIVSAILVSLSALPVVLTKIPGPSVTTSDHLSLRALLRASPLGVVGTGATGVLLGTFYGLGAVYARRLGLGIGETAFFMSAVIAGGVVLQWPIGWLSDRFDRRTVIVVALAGTVLASIGMVLMASAAVLPWLGAVFGGLVFALYPLCVAHTNDRLIASEQLSASSVLIFVYSAGAAAGPLLGSFAMATFGSPGLFGFTAAIAGATLAFALARQVVNQPVPGDLQQRYQILPRTTTVSALLEPASDEPATDADD